MMFPVVITFMLLAVIVSLAYPFFRRSGTPLIVGKEAARDEEEVNLEIERQTLLGALSELEVDYAQGKVSPADYDRLKLGQEHRLVTVLDRLDAMTKAGPKRARRREGRSVASTVSWSLIVIVGLVVAGGSTGIYKLVHWKFERNAVAAGGGEIAAPPPINPAEMVARLEKRLKENPNDLQGQIMAGRSYMALERWEDAKTAWRKVLELDPRNSTAHYRLGEILIRTITPGDSAVAEEALAHFDKALIVVPQDASVLWARGIVLIQLGRIAEADEAWTEAFQYIPQ
ncbi:MAG: tetratricopeptide repeat protein, partial [Nitrospiria bacterium]